jgi:hypothetical protein
MEAGRRRSLQKKKGTIPGICTDLSTRWCIYRGFRPRPRWPPLGKMLRTGLGDWGPTSRFPFPQLRSNRVRGLPAPPGPWTARPPIEEVELLLMVDFNPRWPPDLN